MQAAKDSFYMALCGRLQQVNPRRTVVLGGEVRPGLVVLENEPGVGEQPAEAFCEEWGPAKAVSEGPYVSGRLMCADVTVRYRTCGANNGDGDRGRSLTAMDAELLEITTPQQTPKLDYSQDATVALGSKVFWNSPAFSALTQTARMLGRSATMKVYFYPECEA